MLPSPLLPLLLLAALTQAHPQKPLLLKDKNSASNLLTQDIIDEFDQLRKDWGIKGASVAVVRQDTVSGDWKEDVLAFGVADRHDNPVTEKASFPSRPASLPWPNPDNNLLLTQTLFSIASNSKLFAAIAANLIVHNETTLHGPANARLTQTTKIKDVVPSWRLMDPVASDGADLIDILSHRTGLPRHDGFYA
ncbi:hypothetical protein QFC22_003757 [Naganishia vaughanmartiniae]|uniref:Uncharacterized protein n=1 Tax=Naganishia vaughanmartiniae TaxID=1424756 RepID=A0ACC2X3E6_9TREE|nr:hypothetical protein QFC22_003757 [Naganishia vaughanmartiniae]